MVEYAKSHSKETCKETTLEDIIRFGRAKHQRYMRYFVQSGKELRKTPKKKNVKVEEAQRPVEFRAQNWVPNPNIIEGDDIRIGIEPNHMFRVNWDDLRNDDNN